MATYVYETVPAKPGQKTKRFEIKQSMKDAPLKKHPETGEPIRRVVSGGFGLMGAGVTSASAAPKAKSSGGSCGTGCGCH